MAGRGRGRGGNSTLTHEQLQALGVSRGENAPAAVVPPPLFPRLETKPQPLVSDATTEYMILVNNQFIQFLHDSPAYVRPQEQNDGVERYSDKYKVLARKNQVLDCNYANMPAELRPQASRTKTSHKRPVKNSEDIAKKLRTLESKENEQSVEETEENDDENSTMRKEQTNDDDEVEDDQEPEDYEVDDGTDYANNFFDNGEDYDDEEDNLDDGPVY